MTANRVGAGSCAASMHSLAAFARRGDPNAPAALGATWPSKPTVDATATAKAITVE